MAKLVIYRLVPCELIDDDVSAERDSSLHIQRPSYNDQSFIIFVIALVKGKKQKPQKILRQAP